MKFFALAGSIGFAALLLTSSIAQAQPYGDRWESCRERIWSAERHLDRAIDRFGRRSWQARDARHDLERTRDFCANRWHRRDWDHGWRDRGDDGPRDRHDGPRDWHH